MQGQKAFARINECREFRHDCDEMMCIDSRSLMFDTSEMQIEKRRKNFDFF